MTKQELLKQIEIEIDKSGIESFQNILSRYDKKWRYPQLGDSQAKCPMLDFMFKTEYRSGTLIFVPDADNKFGKTGNTERNSEEG